MTRLAFRIWYRGRRITVSATPTEATYELGDGAPITLTHHGDPFTLDGPVRRPIPPAPVRPRPTQPPGRAPARRQPAA